MKKYMILLIMLCPGFAFAACDSRGCTTTIKRIYATAIADGKVFLEPADNPLNIVNCSPRENIFFILSKSHPLFNEIYSMALSAMMTKTEVRMRIVEGSSGCELSYMWVVSP